MPCMALCGLYGGLVPLTHDGPERRPDAGDLFVYVSCDALCPRHPRTGPRGSPKRRSSTRMDYVTTVNVTV